MIHKYAEIFCWKNVGSFCSAKATHIFSAKNIRILCIESTKTVNEMTLNELVKLTTLWTTGPNWYFNPGPAEPRFALPFQQCRSRSVDYFRTQKLECHLLQILQGIITVRCMIGLMIFDSFIVSLSGEICSWGILFMDLIALEPFWMNKPPFEQSQLIIWLVYKCRSVDNDLPLHVN